MFHRMAAPIIGPRRWVSTIWDTAPDVVAVVGRECEYIERTHPTLMPAAWRGSHVFVASDYGGSHQGSSFDSYAFLIADADALWEWRARMEHVRQTIVKDGRTISFKDRHDTVQQRAEPMFLVAANRIPGVVVTVVVDRTIAHARAFPTRAEVRAAAGDPAQEAVADLLSPVKPPVFERLMRVVWFGSSLVAGLVEPEQSLFWITDDDDIAANTERTELFGKSVAGARGVIQPGAAERVKVTKPSSWPTLAKRLAWGDLLSVADYTAGAVAAALTAGRHIGHNLASPLVQLFPADAIPPDIAALSAWVADDRWPLKRWVLVARPSPSGPNSWDLGSIRIRTYAAA